jgi:hypothetical protein
VEDGVHLKRSETFKRYPNDYILVQLDNRDLFDPYGMVLYIGDSFDELFSLMIKKEIPLGIVYEGENMQFSLGGIG